MSVHPWFKFYPRDWRGDQALRAVSIAARGLWMECLCIMHEAKPYGHLLLNGEPVEDDTLARMTGVPADEVRALMRELRQAGVLSVTSKGVIFSRRMTKDHARARKGQKAAGKRWAQASDGVEQSEAPNSIPNRLPITQKPEARYQKEEAKASSTRAINREFHDEFWPLYPHKVGKADALKAYVVARRKVEKQTILDGVKRYVEHKPPDRNWCNPGTFLRQERWADEPAGAAPTREDKQYEIMMNVARGG